MSYKTRGKKKDQFSKAKFWLRIFWQRFWQWLKSIKPHQEETMRLPSTTKIMQVLRQKNSLVRKNNLKINDWVDGFINQVTLEGGELTLLTQCCLSKDLEQRFERQGKQFTPTKKERLLFERELPDIAALFINSGVRLNWIFSFNRSYLNSGRMKQDIEQQFKTMIAELAEPLTQQGWLLLLNWEDDILGQRFTVDQKTIDLAIKQVSESALKLEIERQKKWAREEAGLKQTNEETKADVYYQISCEAAEGKLLTSAESPIGTLLLVPLESAERYDFFTLFAPDFKKRIVSVLSSYPWRLE